jgi:hypothetical protein
VFSPDGGVEKSLDTARKSTCATSPVSKLPIQAKLNS